MILTNYNLRQYFKPKHFESQHKHDFLASGTDKMWRLEDLSLSIAGGDEIQPSAH